jgi:hypothetical protein
MFHVKHSYENLHITLSRLPLAPKLQRDGDSLRRGCLIIAARTPTLRDHRIVFRAMTPLHGLSE